MDLMDELDLIIEKISKAKPVPLSASAMINKQEILDHLESLKQTAPEELKQARWVMRDREEVLQSTQRQAEKLLSDAQAERDRLVAKTEIVAAANREADKIIEDAKNRAREIRMQAEDYVDEKLASFEVVLSKTLTAVEKGRERLRGRLDVQPEPEPEIPEEEVPPEPSNVRIKRP